MLIPCIDLQSGQAVQLVHGRRRELAVSDVNAQLHKFRRYKWLHIVDLDAAMNKNQHRPCQTINQARRDANRHRQRRIR